MRGEVRHAGQGLTPKHRALTTARQGRKALGVSGGKVIVRRGEPREALTGRKANGHQERSAGSEGEGRPGRESNPHRPLSGSGALSIKLPGRSRQSARSRFPVTGRTTLKGWGTRRTLSSNEAEAAPVIRLGFLGTYPVGVCRIDWIKGRPGRPLSFQVSGQRSKPAGRDSARGSMASHESAVPQAGHYTLHCVHEEKNSDYESYPGLCCVSDAATGRLCI